MSTNTKAIVLAVLVWWPGLSLAMETISGFKPLYPKQEYSFWRAQLEMEVVDSLQPTLRWKPFPGLHQFAPGDSGKPFIPLADAARAQNVRYDVRIWQVENLTAGAVVYERFAIKTNSHTVEKPLQPSTPYFWSIRARFEIDGETRLSEWSLSMIPRVGYDSVRNQARKSGQIPATSFFRFETPSAIQARRAKKATQKINPVIAMQTISGSQSNNDIQALNDLYHKGLLTESQYLEKRKALADQRIQEALIFRCESGECRKQQTTISTQKINPVIGMQTITGSQSNSDRTAFDPRLQRWANIVHKTANQTWCDSDVPKLISATANQENYHVQCHSGEALIFRCESGECRKQQTTISTQKIDPDKAVQNISGSIKAIINKVDNTKHERRLTSVEITALYSGNTEDVFESENRGLIPADNIIVFSVKGTMSGSTKLGNADDGKWWVDHDHLCRQWSRWQDRETKCFRVMQHGSRVRWIPLSGGAGSVHRPRRL